MIRSMTGVTELLQWNQDKDDKGVVHGITIQHTVGLSERRWYSTAAGGSALVARVL